MAQVRNVSRLDLEVPRNGRFVEVKAGEALDVADDEVESFNHQTAWALVTSAKAPKE